MELSTIDRALIWLDDIRDPRYNDFVNHWLNQDKKGMSYVFWIKNYNDFIALIKEKSLFKYIDYICFDHDIASFDENGKEYTGYDAAKFLVDFCLDNDLKLPNFISQSDNGPGKENIIKLLENFKNFNK